MSNYNYKTLSLTLGLGVVDYIKNCRKAKESAKKQVQDTVNSFKQDGKIIANDIKVVHQNQCRVFNNTIRTFPQRMTQAARRQVQAVRRVATKAINSVKKSCETRSTICPACY
ncbi:hypothetical protein [Limosilactobacillus reuteri]|uniref:hypothetical protein n=1 Tax=Limosilactobacillus reuteri TaxID=1598 RepID=UPI0002F979EE|nr:hypothetical protein [Limosilactobacillus reuteri]